LFSSDATRLTSAGLVALATLGAGACRKQPIFVTEAEFTRNNDAGCFDPNGGPLGSMDTYIVEMYEVFDPNLTNPNARQTQAACQSCIASIDGGMPGCRPEKKFCICSQAMPADPDSLHAAITSAGARFTGLDNNDFYCIRVMAGFSGAVGRSASNVCTCDPEWTMSWWLEQNGRMCAVSQQLPIGAQFYQLEIKCPNDRFGGGRFGGNTNFTYLDCLIPNPADRTDAGAPD